MSQIPVQIVDKFVEVIQGDTALAAWVSSNFKGRTLFVKQGFYTTGQLEASMFPGCVVVIGDEQRDDNLTFETDVVVTVFIDQADRDPKTAQELIITLARKVADLFNAGTNGFVLGGLVDGVMLDGIRTDAGVMLPKLYRSLSFTTQYEG